ncbi:MAG: lytic transglycosylase domain-containing protein [Fimbriimonadales bacterium]|nr:lytic transglycosylase domain-containing protein [Fimbriimonadales bacterium]MDW8051374.1 lytic transglycosylase domain-containing protein [Armatimonadota bacterium]
MLRRAWLWLIGGWLCGSVGAQELEPYLRLRAAYHIKAPTPIAGLELAVGKRVLEVEGTVVGSITVDQHRSILMEVEPGRSVVITIGEGHSWLTRGQVRIRAVVQVERESELVTPTYRLLGATYASLMARWEAEQRAKQAAQASQPPTTRRYPRAHTLTSRGKRSSASPPLNPAADWDTFRANLHRYQPIYAHFIRCVNPRLSKELADQIAWAILRFSAYYGVDPRFIVAIVLVESGFNPNATSRKGAAGLGQLMPATARGLGIVDPYDPVQNLYGTVRLIRGHLEKYWARTGNPYSWEYVVLALAAYNAGSGAVRKYGGVPPYKETQNYVRKVIQVYKRLCGVRD